MKKISVPALEMLETKRDKDPPKKHGNMPLWKCAQARKNRGTSRMFPGFPSSEARR